MINLHENNEWEIDKFCAKGMSTGTGAGTACLKACIDYAKNSKAEKIVIISNRNVKQQYTYTGNSVLKKFRLTRKDFHLIEQILHLNRKSYNNYSYSFFFKN